MRRLRPVALALAGAVATACSDGADIGRVLVTSGFTDQVFVLDAGSGAILDSVSLDRRPGERDEPHAVAAAPDGRHWYATLSHGEPTLWKYETAGDRLVGRLSLPHLGASRVRLSPDGALAAVPEYRLDRDSVPGAVVLVRTRDLVVERVVQPCPAPHDAAFNRDGALLAVTCPVGAEAGVVILDPISLGVVRRWSAPAGSRPMNAAWDPRTGDVVVSLAGAGRVVRLETRTDEVAVAGVGAGPAQLAWSPDGVRLVVANRGDGTVSVLASSLTELVRVTVPGAFPHGVAFGPDPDVAYVTYEGRSDGFGGVVAIDLGAGSIRWHTTVGQLTLGVAHSRVAPASNSSAADPMQ